MKNKNFVLVIVIVSSFLILISNNATPARALDYSFDVEKEVVDVYIEKDGSITIEYNITFFCHLGAHEIDIVDIGFPNKYYDIESVTARLDGHKIVDIRASTFIDIGVEIHLWEHAIQPGEKGTLSVKGENPRMVYQDYEDQSMCSVEFSPTWFDSDFCDKFDYLEVNMHFPDDECEGDEVKYHYSKFDDNSHDDDGNLVYTWIEKDADMKQYTYGVSFPKKYVNNYVPWNENPELAILVVTILILISLMGLLAGGIFLLYRYKKHYKKKYYPPVPRYRGGDLGGMVCGFAFMGGFVVLFIWLFLEDIFLLIGFFALLVAGFWTIGYLIFRGIKHLRLPYEKPNIKIDMVGVNKNLSVVEAAIIQNVPLGKVIFLIIFSLVRTGHLQITEAEPLQFRKVSPKNKERLRAYQQKFIKAIVTKGKKKGTINEPKLKKLLVDLIKSTYKNMSVYKLESTIHYYHNMILRAWKEVMELPKDIDWKHIEKYYDWLILDELFEDRSEKYLRNRYYHHRPYWYDRYYYHRYYYNTRGYNRYHSKSSNLPPKEHINIFSISQSIVHGMENISNSIVSNFSSFSDSIINKASPPRTTSSGSHRSSSGGCACACAGCACACAGGGR